MRLKSIFFALAAMIGSTSAMAGPVTCYVEGTVGVGVASSKLSIDPVVSLDGLSSNGALYAPGVGCDYRMTGTMIVGIMGRYDLGSLDTTLSILGTDISAKLEKQWMIGARIGVELNPATIAYGLVGFGGAKMDLSDLGPNLSYNPKGKTVGAGIEWMINGPLVGKVEYTYTMYDKQSFDLGGPVLDVKTDAHAVRAGLVYRFLDAPTAAPMK